MRRSTRRAERMRTVVDCLPYETKLAMLDGLERYRIIAGAYSDRGGGVCPMLAAHRCGGRTDFRSFARAWDRFTGAKRARRADERELRTLRAQLERSVFQEEETRSALVGGASRPVRSQPECPRRASLGAWLVPFTDWEEYVRAVGRAMEQMYGEPARDRRTPSPPAAPSSPPESRTRETVGAGT